MAPSPRELARAPTEFAVAILVPVCIADAG
jgi:hypothetical protein